MIKKLFGLLMIIALGNAAVAQEEAEVSDYEIYRYALLNATIDEMKKDISRELNDMIANQEGMTGKRYKELSDAYGDEAALEAMEAKEFEIKFIEIVEKEKEKRIDAIKSVNQDLATKMVGNRGKTYKAVKNAISNDSELKAKYDSFMAEISFTEE
jgi:hypothetical protein